MSDPHAPYPPLPPYPGLPRVEPPSPPADPPASRRGRALLGAGIAVVVVVALVALALGRSSTGDAVAGGGGATASASLAPASASPSPLNPSDHGRRWTGTGVAITLPNAWVAGATVDDLARNGGMTAAEAAQVRSNLEAQPMATEALRLVAAGDGGLAIMGLDIGSLGDLPSATLTDQFLSGMEAAGATVVSRKDVSVDGQPAVEVQLDSTGSGRALVFVWSKGSTLWMALWSAGAGSFDAAVPHFEAATATISTSA